MELLDALLRVTDQLLMVAEPDGLGGAGGGAGRLLTVDQTVVAQGALLGGALVGNLVRPPAPVVKVPSSRRSMTPKGQAATQVPQPLQTSGCTTTEPNSER